MGTIKSTIKLKDRMSPVLENITKKINAINKATMALNKGFNQTEREQKEIEVLTEKINKLKSQNKILQDRITNSTNKTKVATQQVNDAQQKFNRSLKQGGDLAGTLEGKIKALASAYLGIMGARAFSETADTMIGAENRFNALNGGNQDMTDATIRKIYTSSQTSRSGFADNVSNVAKLMTNAGDAFQNNTDLAIKFNETMAKSYTLGGASAQEMASSMYQLTQALGAGVLAGDELRSVREGAPYAYNVMEEYAQKIFNTNQSLKELASQGKITADLVTEAILNSSDTIDEAFDKTNATWGQRWQQFKNDATMAFLPVISLWKQIINSDAFIAFMNLLKFALAKVAQAVYFVMAILKNVFEFVMNNWSWMRFVLFAIASVIGIIASNLALLTLKVILFGEHGLIAGIKTSMAFAPITAIILGILFVIAMVILAMKKWQGVSEVVCGIIFSAIEMVKIVFSKLIDFIMQRVIDLSKMLQIFANFFARLFDNPVGALTNLISDFVNFFVEKMKPILAIWDGLFGTNLSASISLGNQKVKDWASSHNKGYTPKYSFADDLEKWYSGTSIYNKATNAGSNLKNAWETGKQKGATAHEILNGKFDLSNLYATDTSYADAQLSPVDSYNNATGQPINSIDDSTKKTADNTDKMVNNTKEMADILRKMAENNAVNRYSAMYIDVNMVNNNNVSGASDVQGLYVDFASQLAQAIYDESRVTANGV